MLAYTLLTITVCTLGMCYSQGKHYTCLLWCHILPVCTSACTLVHDVGQSPTSWTNVQAFRDKHALLCPRLVRVYWSR